MPRAKPYPADDPGAQDSAWEEDASTTVEPAEVPDKLRPLGFSKLTGNTGTHTGTGVDEPTVDDQHAPVLSAITPIRPDNVARLIITQGNDAGQEIELRPGKPHTIGRGLDNDIVLTDISVSRKHFDLRFEDGAWIIADRGSGNGTVVNGNVEDNPFMLASGDVIEIGNTVFRFDQPNGVPRPSSQRTYDLDDEEMSTVAGKPIRPESQSPMSPQPRLRPKTQPPPVPPRNASASVPPLTPNVSSTLPPPPLGPQGFAPPLQPASTLPMPQMANRPPLGAAGAPTMMGDAMGMPMGQPGPQLLHDSGGMIGSTLPGQGPAQLASYPYPQAQEIPPHSVHAQMLLIQQSQRRGDASTAHVPPAPYDPMLAYGAPPRQQPRGTLSKRAKLAIAGVGLALLTGVVTAAVVKSGASKAKPAVTAKAGGASNVKDKRAGAKDGNGKLEPTAISSKPIVEPIETKPTVEPINVPATGTPTSGSNTTAPKTDDVAKIEPPKDAVKDPPTTDIAKVEPKPAKVEPKPAKVEPKPAKVEPKKIESKVDRRAKPDQREARRDPGGSTKRVATATDASAARNKADGLYKNRRFSEAASVLAAAARSAGDDDASDLRELGNKYSLLGKAMAQGMAPAQKAAIAYKALTQALNLDANVGGNFKSELNEKIASVAPKAAVAFVAQKDWGNARAAYLAAQRAGSTDSNLAIVKQKLETFASELYARASAEANSSPGTAKEKLRQIKTLVDAKSPIAVKAQALYNKL